MKAQSVHVEMSFDIEIDSDDLAAALFHRAFEAGRAAIIPPAPEASPPPLARRRGRSNGAAAAERPEPEPEPPPPEPEPEPEPELTEQSLRAVLHQLAGKAGPAEVTAMIKRVSGGKDRIASIPQTMWPALAAEANRLLAS